MRLDEIVRSMNKTDRVMKRAAWMAVAFSIALAVGGAFGGRKEGINNFSEYRVVDDAYNSLDNRYEVGKSN